MAHQPFLFSPRTPAALQSYSGNAMLTFYPLRYKVLAIFTVLCLAESCTCRQLPKPGSCPALYGTRNLLAESRVCLNTLQKQSHELENCRIDTPAIGMDAGRVDLGSYLIALPLLVGFLGREPAI